MALPARFIRLAALPLWLALVCGAAAVAAAADATAEAADRVAATAEPATAAPGAAPVALPDEAPPAGNALPYPRPALTGAPAAGEGAPTAVGTGNLLLGMLFLLLLVVGAWWLVRRMGGLQVHGGAGGMQVLAALPVGPRERVVLVAVGGQQLLLGVAPGRVSLLMKLDEPLDTSGNGGDFATRMRQLLQQGLGR